MGVEESHRQRLHMVKDFLLEFAGQTPPRPASGKQPAGHSNKRRPQEKDQGYIQEPTEQLSTTQPARILPAGDVFNRGG